MLTVRYTTDQDYERFIADDSQKAEFETVAEMFYGFQKPHCLTLLDNNEPVILIGMAEKWNRVYDTFTIYSKLWKPIYFRSFVKIAKEYFSKVDCDRIEHLISCDRPWTDKTARLFGFKYNCTLHKYINGKDYKLYEIVK